jgi:hypothetical protein
VQPGSEVFSSDGKKLGHVKHFFSAAPAPAPDDATPDTGPDTSSDAPTEEESGEIAVAVTDTSGSPSIYDAAPFSDEDLPPEAEVPGGGPLLALGASDTKYIEVHHGGHLHIGGESLYVPFNAVRMIEDDGSAVLRYTADQARAAYAQKPAPLDDE